MVPRAHPCRYIGHVPYCVFSFQLWENELSEGTIHITLAILKSVFVCLSHFHFKLFFLTGQKNGDGLFL